MESCNFPLGVIPRRLNFIFRRFGTPCSVFIGVVSRRKVVLRPHHKDIWWGEAELQLHLLTSALDGGGQPDAPAALAPG
jgi:hypothetical protein